MYERLDPFYTIQTSSTVVFIDFTKASDVVSYDKLLIRLAACGITGTLL